MAWMDELRGSQRDSAAALVGLFEQYGLKTLAPKIVDYLQQGYGADTIYTLLQQTKEWKTRFVANEARRKAGLAVLTPEEYLATERGYRQALQAAGVPKGFYDSIGDFTKFLTLDVSPDEIAERAMKAREVVDTIDATQKKALAHMGLDAGTLMAHYLDPNRAFPILQKQVDVALLNAERERAGFGYSNSQAESLYDMGITSEQAREGYGIIGQQLPTLEKLGDISGIDYGLGDFESEVFGGDADSTRTRGKLASQERARFSGSGGTGAGTLTRDRKFN